MRAGSVWFAWGVRVFCVGCVGGSVWFPWGVRVVRMGGLGLFGNLGRGGGERESVYSIAKQVIVKRRVAFGVIPQSMGSNIWQSEEGGGSRQQ